MRHGPPLGRRLELTPALISFYTGRTRATTVTEGPAGGQDPLAVYVMHT